MWRTIVAVAAFMGASSASAIDINVTLDNDGQNPAGDPNGNRLLAIAEAAAAYWERVLPGSSPFGTSTFSVEISYNADDLSSEDTLAHNTGGDIEVRPVPNGSGWFYDDTPGAVLDDGYDFTSNGSNDAANFRGRYLFGTLTSAERNDWFINPQTITGTLEVGFHGVAPSGSPMDGLIDLFSTVIHEIGHEIGINSGNDDFYPFYNGHVGLGGSGASAGVDAFGTGHIEPRGVLMCQSCERQNVRRLPTATDVLAIASAQDPFGGSVTPDL
jgi:hypothetical protein